MFNDKKKNKDLSDYLQTYKTIKRTENFNSNLKIRLKDTYDFCAKKLKTNLYDRVCIYYKFLKNVRLIKSNFTDGNFNITFKNLDTLINFETSFSIKNGILNNFENIIFEYLKDNFGNKDLKLFEIFYSMQFMRTDKILFRKYVKSMNEMMFLDRNSKKILKIFFDVDLLNPNNIKFFAEFLKEIIKTYKKHLNQNTFIDSFHEIEATMNFNKEGDLEKKRYLFNFLKEHFVKIKKKEIKKYPDYLIKIMERNITDLKDFGKSEAILMCLKLIELISNKINSIPKSIFNKLVILFYEIKNSLSVYKARSLTISILIDDVIVKNLIFFKIFLKNYLTYYNNQNDIKNLFYDVLKPIFCEISNFYSDSKFSILKNIEKKACENLKKKDKQIIKIFFMECKSYKKILNYLIKKKNTLELIDFEKKFNISFSTDLIDHYLQIEQHISSYEKNQKNKCFLFDINFLFIERFSYENPIFNDISKIINLDFDLYNKKRCTSLPKLVKETINNYNYIKKDSKTEGEINKMKLVHFFIQITKCPDLILEVKNLNFKMMNYLIKKKNIFDSLIEKIWLNLEKFKKRTELTKKFSEEFISLFEKREIIDKIYRKLNKKNSIDATDFRKSFEKVMEHNEIINYISFMSKKDLKIDNTNRYTKHRRRSVLGSVEPVKSLIELYLDFQENTVFIKMLQKSDLYVKNSEENLFLVNFEKSFMGFLYNIMSEFTFGFDFFTDFVFANYRQVFFFTDIKFYLELKSLKENIGLFIKKYKIKEFPKNILNEIKINYDDLCQSSQMSQKKFVINNIFTYITSTLHHFNIIKEIGADDFIPYLLYTLIYSIPTRFISNLNLLHFFIYDNLKQNDMKLKIMNLRECILRVVKNSVLDNKEYVNFVRKDRYKFLILFFRGRRNKEKKRDFKISNLEEIDYF